jgi:hypothetical protein
MLAPTILERASAYVAACPPAISGERGHAQTFAVACALVHGFALGEADALALLREFNRRCSPPWTERELAHKITSAAQSTPSKPRGHLLGRNDQPLRKTAISRPLARPSSKIDPTTAIENYLKGWRCSEYEIWEASPLRPPDDWHQDALALVEAFYQPGERVNFVTAYQETDGKARPSGTGETVERNALLARWREHGMTSSPAGGWLRMNPVDGLGVADANVTAHRFALLECDDVPLALQLCLFAKLRIPLACLLTSGGRSLHAWVRIDATGPDEYRSIVTKTLALLARFGVDGKNKNPSRLSRLPGVQRTIGASGDGHQRLLYLNPNPVQKPTVA